MTEKGSPEYLPDARGMSARDDVVTVRTTLVSSEVSSIPALHELKTWRGAPRENVIRVRTRASRSMRACVPGAVARCTCACPGALCACRRASRLPLTSLSRHACGVHVAGRRRPREQALLQLRDLDEKDAARHVNDLLDAVLDLLSASDTELAGDQADDADTTTGDATAAVQALDSRAANAGAGGSLRSIGEGDGDGASSGGGGGGYRVTGTSQIAVLRRAGYALLVALVDKLTTPRATFKRGPASAGTGSDGADAGAGVTAGAGAGAGAGASASGGDGATTVTYARSFRSALDAYLRTRFHSGYVHAVSCARCNHHTPSHHPSSPHPCLRPSASHC